MLEILFSVLMLLLPITAILFKRFIPLFLFAIIGANPYVTAGALLLALLTRFQDIFKHKINSSLLILCLIWLGYGLFIGLTNFSFAFVSEYIQLIIAILLLVYIYHTLNTEKQFIYLLKSLMLSGALLSCFEIIIFFIDQDINTPSFIGRISENYTSFYLVISTIIVPLFFRKKNGVLVVLLFLGFAAIYVNESRAMLLLSLLFVCKEFVSFSNILIRLFMSVILVSIFTYIVVTFDSALIYDPNSIFSILNFENNFSNLERLNLLLYSFQLFISNLWGYGLGSSYDIFVNNPVTINEHYPHPHNTLAFLAVELGVIGVWLYIYFFYSMYLSIKKTIDMQISKFIFNISLALFLFSVVDVIFYNGVLMLIVFLLYAMALSTQKYNG